MDKRIASEDDRPEVVLRISNVVCTFSTSCRINLRHLAMTGMNVIYKKEVGVVSMKLRQPNLTATIWSSGIVACTGCFSEEEALVGAKKVARCLCRLGFKIKMCKFKITNVFGSCSLPFRINVETLSASYPNNASYEPEICPGISFRIDEINSTVRIFQTGGLTIMAASVENVQRAVEIVHHVAVNFQKVKDYDGELNYFSRRGNRKRTSSRTGDRPLKKMKIGNGNESGISFRP